MICNGGVFYKKIIFVRKTKKIRQDSHLILQIKLLN